MAGLPAKATTRRTGRVSATERFHRTAGKGGSPVKVLVGTIGAVFLVAVAWILLSPRNDEGITLYHVDQAIGEAHKADDRGDLALAQAKYEEALRTMGDGERWKTRAIELRAAIQELKTRRADLAKAEAEWKALQAEIGACPDAQVHDVLTKTKAVRERHRAMAWVAAIDAEIAKLEKRQDALRVPDPPQKRKEIVEKRKLDDRKGAADWSGAVRDWKDYLALPRLPADYRPKAQEELARVHALAREDFDLLRKRADRTAEEKGKKDALELLKSARKRFELTESAPALEQRIASLDR